MTRVAAIDMGTNSTRLLVADVDGAGRDAVGAGKLVTVDRRTQITRLGQGVDRDRTLQPDAIERTLAVLREYRTVIDDLGVERVRATATSAARDASNRDDVFDPVEQLLGVRPELLAGEDEARLEFLGATADLDATEPVSRRRRRRRFDRVHRRHRRARRSDLDRRRLRAAHRAVPALRPADRRGAEPGGVGRARPPRRRRARAAGRRGTRRRSSAPRARCGRWPRSSWVSTPTRSDLIDHFVLTRAAAEDVFRTLATEPIDQRRHNPGLEPGRVDVIVGGAIVVVGVMRHWGFDSLLVSEADILDGLARDASAARAAATAGRRSRVTAADRASFIRRIADITRCGRADLRNGTDEAQLRRRAFDRARSARGARRRPPTRSRAPGPCSSSSRRSGVRTDCTTRLRLRSTRRRRCRRSRSTRRSNCPTTTSRASPAPPRNSHGAWSWATTPASKTHCTCSAGAGTASRASPSSKLHNHRSLALRLPPVGFAVAQLRVARAAPPSGRLRCRTAPGRSRCASLRSASLSQLRSLALRLPPVGFAVAPRFAFREGGRRVHDRLTVDRSVRSGTRHRRSSPSTTTTVSASGPASTVVGPQSTPAPGSGALPFTGGEVRGILVIGLACLLAGALLLFRRRR